MNCAENVSVNQKLCLCFVNQYCFIAISSVSFLRIMGATLYVQFSTLCSYTKKVQKKNLDTMHHLYVVVSERGGGAEKRLVFISKNIPVFTNDSLVKSCYP